MDFVSNEVVVEDTVVVTGNDNVIGLMVVVSSKSKSSSGSSENTIAIEINMLIIGRNGK